MAKAPTKTATAQAEQPDSEAAVEQPTSKQNQRDMNDPQLSAQEAVAKNLADQSAD